MRQSARRPHRSVSDDGEEASVSGGGGTHKFPQVTRHRSLLTGATVPPVTSVPTKSSAESEPGDPIKNAGLQVQQRRRRRDSVGANLSGTKFDIIHEAVERLGFDISPDEDFATPYLIWNDLGVPTERVSELRPHQRINHFPGMSEISRKDLLCRNMTRLAKMLPQEYDFVPRTWCLPGEYSQFLQHVRDLRKTGKSRSFIYKPANGSMGHGIRIFKSGEQVPTGSDASAIVQEYIAKPLLIDGFKCDLRIYVLVTSCDPLRVYFYNDGLLRLSTEKYVDPQNCDTDTLYMHLTNYSINKHNQNYEKGEDDATGSKRSIRFLNEYLQRRNYDIQLMWRNIAELLVKTILAAQPHILQSYRMCRPASPPGSDSVCFEILGFDVLLDHKLKPWLLEVNRSPSFGADEEIDRRVKLGMLQEAFRLLNIRVSDRARHANEQKAQAQRRLMRGRSEQREAAANGGGAAQQLQVQQQQQQQQQLARRRDELLAQLTRLRRESDREEHEIRTCRKFRRIFPGEDRVRQERYVAIMLSAFTAIVPGRSNAALKELQAQYGMERPRQEELLELLARCEAAQAEAAAVRYLPGHQHQHQHHHHRHLPTFVSLTGGGGQTDEDNTDEDDSDLTADDCSYDGTADGAEVGESSVEVPDDGITRFPSVPGTARSSRPAQRRGRNIVQSERSADSAPLTVDPLEADQLNRRILSQLNEICIRFPGKSTQQAQSVLSNLRTNWNLNKSQVANYWLVKLDNDKRRKILEIVRQNVRSAVQRCFRVSDVEEVRLCRLFSLVFGRLLSQNGQGLWATFSDFPSWEAALLRLREAPSLAEMNCCRRIVQLCQDCLLTVFLFSGQPAPAGAAARPLSVDRTGSPMTQHTASTPRTSSLR